MKKKLSLIKQAAIVTSNFESFRRIINYYLSPEHINIEGECIKSKFTRSDGKNPLSIEINNNGKKMVFRKFYMIWKLTKENKQFDLNKIYTRSICGNNFCINPDHFEVINYGTEEHVNNFINCYSDNLKRFDTKRLQRAIEIGEEIILNNYKIEELNETLNKIKLFIVNLTLEVNN